MFDMEIGYCLISELFGERADEMWKNFYEKHCKILSTWWLDLSREDKEVLFLCGAKLVKKNCYNVPLTFNVEKGDFKLDCHTEED